MRDAALARISLSPRLPMPALNGLLRCTILYALQRRRVFTRDVRSAVRSGRRRAFLGGAHDSDDAQE